MERVSGHSLLREPSLVERGKREAAEHGSGAAGVNVLARDGGARYSAGVCWYSPRRFPARDARSKVVTRIFSVLVPYGARTVSFLKEEFFWRQLLSCKS